MTQVGQVSVGLGLDDANFKKGLKDAEKQTMTFANSMKSALTAIGLGFSVKAIIDGISSSVEAFRTQEIAVKQLNNALANSGQYSEQYSQHLQDLASSLQKVTNYGDEVTLKAVSIGQAFAGNVKLTDELITATLDFASATGTDLDTAFKLVGKSVGSSTNAFKRYGIELDSGMSKEQKVIALQTQLANKFDGSAQSMANATIQLKNAFGDLTESIGRAFNPAVVSVQKNLINMVNGLKSAVDWVNNLKIKYYEFMRDSNNRYADASFFNKQKSYYKDEAKHYQDLIDKSKTLNTIQNKNPQNAVASTTSTKTKQAKQEKQAQDEYLENYKNFINEFKQATNEYNSTLQARKKVESMGLTPMSEDYSTQLEAYKQYYSKVAEIQQSKTRNKNELLKKEETQLQQELQLIALNKQDETYKKSEEKRKEILDAQLSLEDTESAYQTSGGFLASFGASFDERLNIEKEYLQKRRELINTEFTDMQQKQDAFNDLELYRTQQYAQLELDTWRQRGHDVESIFENSLSTMLTNYGDFGDNMQQLALNLTQYIIKQMIQMAITSTTVKTILNSVGSWFGGLFGGTAISMVGTLAHSGHTFLAKHHYGGTELPQADQTEHFALIKNNERVLSPSETSAYNQGDSSSQPNYIVYAPQVRAMDSKDVASWFNDNKQQILGIVSQGIRDNKQGLRTQIQGV